MTTVIHFKDDNALSAYGKWADKHNAIPMEDFYAWFTEIPEEIDEYIESVKDVSPYFIGEFNGGKWIQFITPQEFYDKAQRFEEEF